MKSIAFYRDKLGFDLTFSWGEPVTYAVLNREEAVGIHLVKRTEGTHSHLPSQTALFVFVYDVDALYEEYSAMQVSFLTKPQDREYGMRDFDLKDPDGYILTFGTSLERQSPL